jgi:hypothetical protein
MKIKLIILFGIILISSILLNIYFLTHKPEPVIHTITEIKEVEKPITITKIVTRYETKLITESIYISSDASIEEKSKGYDIIINSELIIKTNPLTIVEDNSGKIFIPKTLTGNADLAFLRYDVNIHLSPKMLWKQKTLPIDIGYGLMNLKPEIGVCIDIPFTTDYDIMLGLTGINVGMKRKILKTTDLRMGMGLDYEKNIVAFFGIRTSIF